MSFFSNREYADIVFVYGFSNGNSGAARREYARRFPERNIPSEAVFIRTFQRLAETGSVRADHRGAGAPAGNVNHEEEILQRFENDPTTSTRLEASRMGISQHKVWKTLNKNRLHPFHYTPVQDLHPGDAEKRLEFCNYLLSRTIDDDTYLKQILWTDECKFDRAGTTNVKNLHYWSVQNPRKTRIKNVQRQFSVNVWAGIFNDTLVGPFILPDTINGTVYLDFLQNTLPGLLEDVPLMDQDEMVFQQDGCPAHFQRDVRTYLDQKYPGRWIGRGGPISWPPRSPDLTPLDFFLWGRMKELVYFKPVVSKEVLLLRIQEAANTIKNELSSRVTTAEVLKRARLCISQNGGHIENYL